MQARTAWDINEAGFPRHGPLASQAWFALRYATLIRVGRGEFAAHTPRRPLEHVAS